MDERQARQALVDQTIRGRGITDPDIVRAMSVVPRHRFVPAPLAARAYEDLPLPIGFDATISQPYVVAWMAELGGVRTGARVLDVGTGSGYQAAVLAEVGANVFSIERVPELLERAHAALSALAVPVHLRLGDGREGWPEQAPFDVILVAAASEFVPPALIAQLAPGGRLVVPLGDESHQELIVIEKTSWGDVRRSSHGAVAFVPLV